MDYRSFLLTCYCRTSECLPFFRGAVQRSHLLQEYILIDQYKAQVEIYSRKGNLWNIGRVSGLDQIVEIAALGVSIELGRIYESVTFV